MKRMHTLIALLLIFLMVIGLQAIAGAQQVHFLSLLKDLDIDLTPYEGKPFLMHFFLETGSYSDGELEKMKRLSEEFSSDDLSILLVHVWAVGENEKNAARMVEKHGLQDLPLIYDKNEAIAEAVNIQTCPFTFYVNREGFMEDAISFPVDYEDMVKILEYMGVQKKGAAPAEEIAAAEATEPVIDPSLGDGEGVDSSSGTEEEPTAPPLPAEEATPEPEASSGGNGGMPPGAKEEVTP